MLRLITLMAGEALSIKTAYEAPRLSASRENEPVPAKRSNTNVSGAITGKMLKTDSFIRSDVGRVFKPRTDVSFLPLCVPLMILKRLPL